MLVACVAEEDPTTSSGEDTTGDSATTDPSGDPTTDPSGDPTTNPSGDPTTDDPSDPTTDDSSDPTTDTSSDPTTDTSADSSTGEPCIPDAELTEVEGCAEPIGEPFCSEGQQHVEQGTDVPWLADPPHSGPHYPTWETWGEHEDVVPRGNWVHNLEHGGIVLTYRCNGDCEPEVDVLREVVAMRPDLRILLTADPMLPGDERFAAISWTWVHRFDTPDLATLLCFADQHENHAPEDVP
jgi:hypothetical protein